MWTLKISRPLKSVVLLFMAVMAKVWLWRELRGLSLWNSADRWTSRNNVFENVRTFLFRFYSVFFLGHTNARYRYVAICTATMVKNSDWIGIHMSWKMQVWRDMSRIAILKAIELGCSTADHKMFENPSLFRNTTFK